MEFLAASGALAWYGEGWWWERPFRIINLIPDDLTIISKTVTFEPRVGNLKMWCPWRCVRLIPGGAVNHVGLTNPGYRWWIENCFRIKDRKVIVSIMPQDVKEAAIMTKELSRCPIVGIEINLSCPNVDHDSSVSYVKNIVNEVLANTIHPVIVKLGYTDPYLDICKELDGKVAAFDLINTVPWAKVFPNKSSPLAKYNLVGGVSGIPIQEYAREVLIKIEPKKMKTPIISGGGIDCVEEVYARRLYGAKAYSFGTVFLRAPWKPKFIMKRARKGWLILPGNIYDSTDK